MQETGQLQDQELLRIGIPTVTGTTLCLKFARGLSGSREELCYLLLRNMINIGTALSSVEDYVKTTSGYQHIRSNVIEKDELNSLIKKVTELLRRYCADKANFTELFPRKYMAIECETKREYVLAIFTTVTSHVSTLSEKNYIEDALAVVEIVQKSMNSIVGEIRELKEKVYRSNKTFCANLLDCYPTLMREEAYCHLQMHNFVIAAIKGAEAEAQLKEIYPGTTLLNKIQYEVFNKCIIAIYQVFEGELSLAVSLLNNIRTSLGNKNNYTHLAIVYASKLLASKLFEKKEYKLSKHYYHYADMILTVHLSYSQAKQIGASQNYVKSDRKRFYDSDINSQQLCHNEIKFAINKLDTIFFKEKTDQLYAAMQSVNFFNKDNPLEINSENYFILLHFTTSELAKSFYRQMILRGMKTCKFVEPSSLKIIEIVEFSLATFHEILTVVNNEATSTKDPVTVPVKTNPSHQPSPLPVPTSFTQIDSLLASSYSLYNNSSIKAHPAIKPENPVERKPLMRTDVSITIIEIAKQLDVNPTNIYPLSNDPYIPAGHWYGYLDIKNLSDLESTLITSARTTLERGKLSSHGQAIKPAKNELADTLYSFKIKLLGSNGKGDTRLYGRVVNIDSNKKLIIFDHYELSAHKRLHLPSKPLQLNNL